MRRLIQTEMCGTSVGNGLLLCGWEEELRGRKLRVLQMRDGTLRGRSSVCGMHGLWGWWVAGIGR